MTLRPCLECGSLIERGSRCERCRRLRNRTRDAMRPTRIARGYDNRWARRSKAAIAEHPRCEWCGATEDLTGDHVIPGDPESPIRVLCRSCNAVRANKERVRG